MSYKPVALALIFCSPFVLSLPAGRQEVPQVQHSPFRSSEGTAPSGGLQAFTGALGGQAAPSVTVGGQGFQVAGQAGSFPNKGAALGRSCDIQHTNCVEFAKSAIGRVAGLTVAQCDEQNTKCLAVTADTPPSKESSASPPAAQAPAAPKTPNTPNTAPASPGRRGLFQASGESKNKGTAPGTSCDSQHEKCLDLANSAAGHAEGLTVAQCDEQNAKCLSDAASNSSSKQPSASSPAGQVPTPPKTPKTSNTAVWRRGFIQVEGEAKNNGAASAPSPSCDVKHNECITVANSAAGKAEGLTVAQCDQQNTQCLAAAASSPATHAPAAPKTPNTPNSAVPSPGNIQTSEEGAVGDDAGSIGRRAFIQLAGAAENKDAACDDKYKKCLAAANSAAGGTAGQTVGQCDQQNVQCRAGASN